MVLIKTIKKNTTNSRDSGSTVAKTMGLELDHLSFDSGFPFLLRWNSHLIEQRPQFLSFLTQYNISMALL